MIADHHQAKEREDGETQTLLCPGLSVLSFQLKTPWDTKVSIFGDLCHSIVTIIRTQHW